MKNRILWCLIIFLYPLLTFSKSGNEHIYDMYLVYPFESNTGRIGDFYKAVQAALDYQVFEYPFNDKRVGNPLFLQKPPFEKTKWGNHRIWYHWGFNKFNKSYIQDPSNPLGAAVKRNIDEKRMSEKDISQFYYELQEENRKRNMALMKYAATVLGYSANNWSSAMRRQINAFVTIPYSVHLLGDHFPDQSETSVISPLYHIVSDVYNAIIDLAGSDPNNYNKAKDMIHKLKAHENNPVSFLKTLQVHFPRYILSLQGGIYDYKRKFTNMGYKLKNLE